MGSEAGRRRKLMLVPSHSHGAKPAGEQGSGDSLSIVPVRMLLGCKSITSPCTCSTAPSRAQDSHPQRV